MDDRAIVNEFIGFYKNLLGSCVDRTPLNLEVILDGPTAREDQWDGLLSSFSKEDVRVALFDIDNEKSPGPDGYGSFFIKFAWPIISDDIFLAVQEFFKSGKLLKQWNHVVIALIPKSDASNKVKDYRPISCCTVIYKIISNCWSTD